MHAAAPTDEYDPMAQVVHVEAEAALYEPAAHAVHPAVSGFVTVPELPAAQTLQDVAATLPVVVVEYPAEQDVQTVLPAGAIYEPAPQMVQPLGVDPVTSEVPP